MKSFTLFFLLFVSLSGTRISQATTLTITVTDFTFTPSGINPATVTINLGDTVMWVWGNGSHNTTSTSIPAGAASWNASISSTAMSFIYVPVLTGTYRYGCPTHATSGMSGLFIVNCGAGPTKPVITSSNGNSACEDGTIYLSTAAQTAATYQWFNGFNPLPNTTNTLNATSAGSYTVRVRRCSIDSTSGPFAVTFYPNPTPSFTSSHAGMSYTFTNTTPLLTSHTYLWSFSDGSPNQTTTNATRTLGSGSYTVSLKATSNVTTCFGATSKVVDTRLDVGSIGGELYTIAPNPVSTLLLINTAIDARLYITDFLGRIVNVPVSGDLRHFRLDVSGLEPGLYALYLATDKGSVTEKITVIH